MNRTALEKLRELSVRLAKLEADLSPPLGVPGGVEYTKERIENAIDDEELESQLVQTVYKGEGISNRDAWLVYGQDDCNMLQNLKLFKGFCTSAHGMFRMDQRGISVDDLGRYFAALEMFLESRAKITSLQPFISQVLSGRGQIKWTNTANRGLTVVFERKGNIAKIITAYFKGKDDPVYRPPTPSYVGVRRRRR
jgi:hypothetical protein